MDDVGKEEGRIMEESSEIKGLNQTYDQAELAGVQEPNPSSVDSVIVEMQKRIGDSGVEMTSDLAPPVVLETTEEAGVGTDEPQVDTGSDKSAGYVYSDVHLESEVPVKVESDKVVGIVDSDVQPESEVCLKTESEENSAKGEGEVELKDAEISEAIPSIELDASTETQNLAGDWDGGSHLTVQTEVSKDVVKDYNDGEEGKALNDGVSSKANPSNEIPINPERDDVVNQVESDMHHDSDIAMKDVTDVVRNKLTPSSEAETDKDFSKLECDGDVAMENLMEVVSNKANPSSEAETDKDFTKLEREGDVAVENLTDVVSNKANPSSESETDKNLSKLERDGDVAMENLTDVVSSKANPSSEAETGRNVSKLERDGGVAMENLTDVVSNKANPSSEAETDRNVSKLERDGGVAMENLTEVAIKKATPSGEADSDRDVSKLERDDDVAMENRTDGVINKATPNSEADNYRDVSEMERDGENLTDAVINKATPSSEAETYRDVSKLERDLPHNSKVVSGKLEDVICSKPKHDPGEPRSCAEADNVCKPEHGMPRNSEVSMEIESESNDDAAKGETPTGGKSKTKFSIHPDIREQIPKAKFHVGREDGMKSSNPDRTFLLDPGAEGNESGTEEEQAEFMKEVENFYKARHLEFKPPKFYKEELNLLKLWRAVIKLGGYEKVTTCKFWRQVGESFNPPKTCTTVSWTFRIFYEKALLEFEKNRWHGNEPALSEEPSRFEIRADGSQTGGSGRTLRDAAARAMQGWHSQRLIGNGEDKQLSTMAKSDKQLKSSGLLKRKRLSPGLDMTVFDIGPPADWVKVNVKRFNDCFEVYALVPGLLREEVHVQSDPVGRLIISGQPRQLDNPWGVTPFKKVVSLSSRIDPLQTSAVVTLNGQLFVRVPFEQSDN